MGPQFPEFHLLALSHYVNFSQCQNHHLQKKVTQSYVQMWRNNLHLSSRFISIWWRITLRNNVSTFHELF